MPCGGGMGPLESTDSSTEQPLTHHHSSKASFYEGINFKAVISMKITVISVLV